MSDDIAIAIVATVLTFSMYVVGGLGGIATVEKQAIKHKHAYYHPTTGDFTWKLDNNTTKRQ